MTLWWHQCVFNNYSQWKLQNFPWSPFGNSAAVVQWRGHLWSPSTLQRSLPPPKAIRRWRRTHPVVCYLNRSFVLKNLHPSFPCWCPSRMNIQIQIYIWYVFTHQTRFSAPSCKSFHLKLLGPVKVVLPIESYHLFKGLEFLSISGKISTKW